MRCSYAAAREIASQVTQKIDPAFRHLLDGRAGGVTAIGNDLLRSLLQPLFPKSLWFLHSFNRRDAAPEDAFRN